MQANEQYRTLSQAQESVPTAPVEASDTPEIVREQALAHLTRLSVELHETRTGVARDAA